MDGGLGQEMVIFVTCRGSKWQREDVGLGDAHPVASLMQGYPVGWAAAPTSGIVWG